MVNLDFYVGALKSSVNLIFISEELEENVLKRLDEYLKAHCDIYNSTRCTVNEEPLNFFAMTWNFSQVILSGLARDGGLYVPKYILPKPDFGQLKRMVPLAYKHKAHIFLEKLIHHSQVSTVIVIYTAIFPYFYENSNFCNSMKLILFHEMQRKE